MSITISGQQRRLLYGIAIERLTNIDAIWHAAKTQDWMKAQELGREYGSILQLLAGGLGWGDDSSDDTQLSCSSEVLEHALALIRREAAVDAEEQRDVRLMAEAQAERIEVFDVCDQLLVAIGGGRRG